MLINIEVRHGLNILKKSIEIDNYEIVAIRNLRSLFEVKFNLLTKEIINELMKHGDEKG